MDLRPEESRFQCTIQGAGLGKEDKGDELLPMQRVPSLHVTDVVQEKGKVPYSLATVPSQECADQITETKIMKILTDVPNLRIIQRAGEGLNDPIMLANVLLVVRELSSPTRYPETKRGGVAYSKAFFGQGEGRILLDSVGCAGDEDNLNMCMVGLPDLMSSSDCGHSEDAGVRCGVEPSTSGPSLSVSPVGVSPLSGKCGDGQSEPNVRLMGTGRLPSSGLVQVRDPSRGIYGFGFVCDDSWNLLNARVVCRELCFDPAEALPGWHKPRSQQLPSSPKILLDDVRCSGSESSLLQCRHQPWNFHDCSPSELAAVTCSSMVAGPQVPQAEVECQKDQMVVTFRRRLNPALRKESLVPAESVPSTCQPQIWTDSTSIRVFLNYRLCAVLLLLLHWFIEDFLFCKQNKGPNGNLTFVSSLLVPLPVGPSPRNDVKRVTEYKINVQCNVAGSYSASRRLPQVGHPVLPASGDARLAVTMIMYQDDTFTEPVTGPDVVLAPGGWINLGLTLNTNQRIKLVVTSCYAGPDLNDPTKPKQPLLLDKCVQEDTVSTYTINDTFWGIRFQPFSFNNFSDVTIDCEAYACKTDVYVLKRINLQRASKKERSAAEQEARLLQKLKHPNIVSYKQSFETPEGMLYIAMQYCEGGDLYTKLKEQKGQLLEERQVVEWFVQIAMALQYMHERNILHRDLKTQNIFLTKSKIIKVGDLGIARVLDGATDMATTLIGTPYYMSPELFSNKPYNHKSDVWALGCCVYEMTTLKHAFNAKDMNSLVYKILKGKLPPMPRQYGPDLLGLMQGMLHQDPDKRPSVNRLLRDPFIKRNIAIFLEDTKRGVRSRRPVGSADRRSPLASSSQSSPVSTSSSAITQQSSSADSAKPPLRPSIQQAGNSDSARSPLRPSSQQDSNPDSIRPPLKPISQQNSSSDSAKPLLRPSSQRNSSSDSARPPLRPSSQQDSSSNSARPPLRPSSQQNSSSDAARPPLRSSSQQDSSADSARPPLRPSSQQDNSADSARLPLRPGSGSSSKMEESRMSSVPAQPSLQQASAVQPELLERDEPDSFAWNMHINSAGDAPGFKPGHGRKPSNLAPKDLEPIDEDGAITKSNTAAKSDSEKEDTVKANTVKEVKEPPAQAEERRKKKKKKKLVPNRAVANSHPASREKEVADSDALSARSDISAPPKSDRPHSARPLPVPKVEVSEGLPQKREPLRQQKEHQGEKAATDSTSSKSSSDGTIDDTPRSLPNLSARDRRRREKASSSMENPPSARNVKLRRVPERITSEKVTQKEKTAVPQLKAANPSRLRQPSLRDSSSSDESLPAPDENTQEREKRRENKEMDNFICLLNNTLKMNNEVDRSDEELMEVPVSPPKAYPNGQKAEAPPHRKYSLQAVKIPLEQKPAPEELAPIIHKSPSMPSVETLTNTTRLMDRIRLLQMDCVKAVGYPVLKKAYDILDKIEEDEVEPKLMDLLGKEKFDEYAGKIWQLKFCEESLFMS